MIVGDTFPTPGFLLRGVTVDKIYVGLREVDDGVELVVGEVFFLVVVVVVVVVVVFVVVVVVMEYGLVVGECRVVGLVVVFVVGAAVVFFSSANIVAFE